MKLIAASLVVTAIVASACSGAPRLAPQPDRDPEVVERRDPAIYASGTTLSGGDETMTVAWDLEEIIGFSHAVSLTAATPTSITVRSASRRSSSDAVWIVGVSLTPDGPPVVFGGVARTVDSVVLVNEAGDELALELIDVPDLDWSVAIEELPSDWSAGGDAELEVVASTSGHELSRERLAGFGS